MTVKDIIIRLLEYDMDANFGFVFYDTPAYDIKITTGVENGVNVVLLFDENYANMESKK